MLARLFAVLVLTLVTLFTVSASAAEVSLDKTEQGYAVKIDGKLFAEYVILSGNKPIVWPIIGPTGKSMTRAYPMQDVDGDRKDHPHHRSLWFSHMEVNDWNFWAEAASYGKKSSEATQKLGLTKHREFKLAKVDGGRALITTLNDWLAPNGSKVLEDERRLAFFATADSRVIDFDIDLTATNGPVKFGDNKDGVFGVRVPTSMDVESKLGGKIVNSEGQVDKDAWGKAAKWCDYFGPVQGETLGLAILNHPSSFRYPTPWHVRTYGLFAANCFGLHDFAPNTSADGSYTLPAGEKLKFRYRVVLHKGDDKQAKIEDAFTAYAKEAK